MVVETVEQIDQFKRQEEAAFQEAQRQAELVAGQLEQLTGGYRELLVAIAANPFVKNKDKQACAEYVEALQQQFQAAFTIGVADGDGDLYCLGVPYLYQKGQIDIGDRWYFTQAIRTKDFVVGEYAFARGPGSPVIHYSYPVKGASSEVAGVVFASVSLKWMAGKLAENPLPAGARLIVADRRGTAMVEQPDMGGSGHLVAREVRALLSRSGPGATALRIGGEERIVGYVPVTSGPTGMSVALVFDRDKVLYSVRQQALRRAATVLGAMFFALLLAWFIARGGLHRPLARLERAAMRWGEGDLEARTELANSKDSEFRQLGSTLDQMAANLALRQQELSMATEEMRRSRDDAMRASLSKTHFLAAASHDLRQPLQAMTLNIALLAARYPDGGEASTVERLRRSVLNLSTLLNALLDVSQLDAGLIEPNYVEFELQTLLQSLLEEFFVGAQQKGLRFIVEPTRVGVRSDSALLGRMLRNLVSNAIKYTPSGGSVRVWTEVHDERVLIFVQDTGDGIAEDKQEEVFEEFRQLGNPQRNPALGLGLGLSIVRRMSLLLDHPVTLKSAAGEGTTFTVSVPMADTPELIPIPRELPTFSGRVLLIEDDPLVGDTTAELLRSWGMQVDVELDAEAAFARLSEQPFPWDAVLADYRLPSSTGLDVILQARAARADVVTVVITGDAADVRAIRLDHPEVDVLQKPVAVEALAQALMKLSEKPRTASA